jgi:hypothetical protein
MSGLVRSQLRGSIHLVASLSAGVSWPASPRRLVAHPSVQGFETTRGCRSRLVMSDRSMAEQKGGEPTKSQAIFELMHHLIASLSYLALFSPSYNACQTPSLPYVSRGERLVRLPGLTLPCLALPRLASPRLSAPKSKKVISCLMPSTIR